MTSADENIYRGDDGTLEERDGSLYLRRHGFAALTAFGAGLRQAPERRIPLDAIREVVVVDNSWRGTSLRLVLGSDPAPGSVRRLGDHPDQVRFTAKQRPEWERLLARLEHVLTVNRSLGIDPSVVEYDRGISWMEHQSQRIGAWKSRRSR